MKVLWSIMILVILGLQYRLWVGNGSFSEVWSLQEVVADQKALNDVVRERNDRLNAEVLDLKSGFAAIEERARFNLGMIGKNETFYMVVTSKL
jgi:cell division protein FtsB